MTTFIALPDAPVDPVDGELLLVRHPTLGSRKRTFSTIVKYVLGSSASVARGFFGAAPVTQPAGANQVAVATTVGAAVATTGATQTTPYGFATAAQADNAIARINQLRIDVLALTVLCNEQRAALVALGLIKGSA